MGRFGRSAWRVGLVGVVVVALAGCSGTDEQSGSDSTTTSTSLAQAQPLKILVSNDDGIDSPGLELLVAELAALGDVDITVVAPAANQSGSSDRTTPGGVTWSEVTTPGGVTGVAVDGLPADAVLVALDELGLDPDVVVSGINEGQNIGPVAALSGTVGVARTAVRAGVPAVAVSAGLEFEPAQFAVAAGLAAGWVADNRDALVERTLTPEVVSFNVPACDPADMGEVVETTLGSTIPEGVNIFVSQCSPVGATWVDDVTALVAGFPTRTVVPTELEPVG